MALVIFLIELFRVCMDQNYFQYYLAKSPFGNNKEHMQFLFSFDRDLQIKQSNTPHRRMDFLGKAKRCY